MRRNSPSYYSPPRRGYGGRGRSPPRRGHGGYGRREQNNGSLLVRNVPLDCRPEDLRVPFERFGAVRDVYLPKDYYSGREPRGFAFVQFVDPYDASEAQYQMNGRLFGGREITVVLAAETRKRPEEMRGKTRTRGQPEHQGRRPSYYARSRSRSHSPRYPSSSRVRPMSRSFSPGPRRRADYSPSPERRHQRSPRERSPSRRDEHHVHRRPHSSGHEEINRNEAENGYKKRGSYDAPEEGGSHWHSSPRAAAQSPSGSRSRSADLSPRHGGR